MISFKKIINNYASFIARHPWIIILIVLLISIVSFHYAQTIKTKSMDYKTMLPDNLEVIKAMDLLDDDFGGSNSVMFAIELNPEDNYSSIKDIRDPKVIKYMNLLGELSLHTDDVVSVTSGATLLKKMNNGLLPKSLNEIISLENKNPILLKPYFSDDKSLALIKISLSDGYDEMSMINSLNKVIETVPKPSGINAYLAGDEIAQPIVQEQLGSDSSRTSMFSMIGIIIILLLLFRSIKYGLLPLATIAVGVIWAFGYIGLTGMGLSSATSGVISMIMGIGIDFGIQTVMRFKQELKKVNTKKGVETAIITTLSNVIAPMATTTLAALIGFKAMSMGELTLMGDMGTMMSYGITACFFAAITVVPALLVLFEKHSIKKKLKSKKMIRGI